MLSQEKGQMKQERYLLPSSMKQQTNIDVTPIS